MKQKFKRFWEISIIKTFRINLHYLPLKDALKFPILCSKKVAFRALNGSVKFSCPIRFGLVRLGFDTLGLVDYKKDRMIWENNGAIEFKGAARIGAASKIIILEGGNFVVGERVAFTGLSRVITKKKISIGNNCLISWDVQIMDTDFHKIMDSHENIINEPKEIEIGNHVWIGCKCLILKGSSIASDIILAANSTVVGKLLNTNSIFGGGACKNTEIGYNMERIRL